MSSACVSGGHHCAGCQALRTHAVSKGHYGSPLWVQDCNAVVYNGNLAKLGAAAYDAIYQTGTANAGMNLAAGCGSSFSVPVPVKQLSTTAQAAHLKTMGYCRAGGAWQHMRQRLATHKSAQLDICLHDCQDRPHTLACRKRPQHTRSGCSGGFSAAGDMHLADLQHAKAVQSPQVEAMWLYVLLISVMCHAGPNPCSLVVGPTSFSVIAANKAVVFNSASHG